MRIVAFLLLVVLIGCRSAPKPSRAAEPSPTPVAAAPAKSSPVGVATKIEIHSVILRGARPPNLRIRWLRGTLTPSRAGEVISFDDRASFEIEVAAGAIGITLDDLTSLMNDRVLAYEGSPLSDVRLAAIGQQVKVTGTLHKGVAVPVEMTGDLAVTQDGRIRVHVAKLRALHMPVKGLLGAFGVKLDDLVNPKGAHGLVIEGNDVLLNPEQILPPPHTRGTITGVRMHDQDMVLFFGNAHAEVMATRERGNYVRFEGGTVRFGKLTMHATDMTMRDAARDNWFEFDFDHYQRQLVAGSAKVTLAGGLEIAMPDYNRLAK